jgi:C4-dicarboxylate-binding protein DctP
MKSIIQKFAGVLLALSVLPLCLNAAHAQIKATAINDIQKDTGKGKTWELFKKLVEQRSPGQIQLTLNHGTALYDQKTVLQALQLGAVQFISPVAGVYSGTFPKLAVLGLPFLMPTPEAIKAVIDDPIISSTLFNDMRAKGIEPLGIWLNGPRDIGRTGSKPVLVPEDVRGLKIRVPPGQNYVEAFKLLGANVTTMSWGEVPTALRQGVIDAVEPTPSAWYASHMYETAKQITRTGYIWDLYIVATNKAWWDGLKPEVRDNFKAAMAEATAWNWKYADEEIKASYEKMKAGGATIYDLTPQQRAEWVNALKPLWNSLGVQLVGKEMMVRILETTAKYR